MAEETTCCFCDGPLWTPEDKTWTGGHNAEPIKDGRCCRPCRDLHVLPVRVANTAAIVEMRNKP
jgi:hypothetical protein